MDDTQFLRVAQSKYELFNPKMIEICQVSLYFYHYFRKKSKFETKTFASISFVRKVTKVCKRKEKISKNDKICKNSALKIFLEKPFLKFFSSLRKEIFEKRHAEPWGRALDNNEAHHWKGRLKINSTICF
jgi:hypothetical protein